MTTCRGGTAALMMRTCRVYARAFCERRSFAFKPVKQVTRCTTICRTNVAPTTAPPASVRPRARGAAPPWRSPGALPAARGWQAWPQPWKRRSRARRGWTCMPRPRRCRPRRRQLPGRARRGVIRYRPRSWVHCSTARSGRRHTTCLRSRRRKRSRRRPQGGAAWTARTIRRAPGERRGAARISSPKRACAELRRPMPSRLLAQLYASSAAR